MAQERTPIELRPGEIGRRYDPTRQPEQRANGSHAPVQPVRWPLTRDSAVEALPDTRWLVQGLLPETGIGMILGHSGMGKSYVALDLAFSLVTGEDWAGQQVQRPGGVLFIASESPAVIAHRWQAIRHTKVKPWWAHRGEEPRDLPIAFMLQDTPRLGHDKSARDLVSAIEQFKADIGDNEAVSVIVDTLSASSDIPDQNDAAQVQRVMNVLAQVSARERLLALVVDHFGKDETKGARGSSAKEAAMDVVLVVDGKKEGLAPIPSDLRLLVRKQRGGLAGLGYPFELREIALPADDPDDEPRRELSVVWSGIASAAVRARRGRRPAGLDLFFNCLFDALDAGGFMRVPMPGMTVQRCVNVDLVRQNYFCRHHLAGEPGKGLQKAWERALKEATGQKSIGTFKPAGSEAFVWATISDRNGQN